MTIITKTITSLLISLIFIFDANSENIILPLLNDEYIDKIEIPFPKEYLKSSDLISELSLTTNSNIILITSNQYFNKLKRYKYLIHTFKYEFYLNNWAILSPTNPDMDTVTSIVNSNIKIMENYLDLDSIKNKGSFTISGFDLNIKALNKTINKFCELNINSEDVIHWLAFRTKKNLNIIDICMSYPLILGVNGISLLEQNGKYYLSKQ